MASNGKTDTNGLRKGDATLVSAIMDLCEGINIELIKLDGLVHAILHRRVVTSKAFRQEFVGRLREISRRHVIAADRIEDEIKAVG